jgi:hypothetical protein
VSIDALRAVRAFLPDAELIQDAGAGDELRAGAYDEQPQVVYTPCLEESTLRAHRVPGDPVVGFAAFLDGIQRARIVSHWHGVPIIEGIVAAVVRVRVNRRFGTWGHRTPIVHRRLYVPFSFVPQRPPATVQGFEVVDTSSDAGEPIVLSRHPAALRSTAFERIGRDRELAEREMAEQWCRSSEGEPIYIDGSISGQGRAAVASCAVGVVKSHTKLYAEEHALDVVMQLRRGERTSVFELRSSTRPTVMSWYLRLRDPRGHDAMFGLVRVEVAFDPRDVTRRANEVSRWVLAEASPVALPDGRWDRMAYGIRDCEEFLRAIAS